MAGITTKIETEQGVEITLVDAPESGADRSGPESQRTYSLLRDGTRAAVRVRRDVEGTDGAYHRYVVENLVGGKWHRLLTGDVGIHRPAITNSETGVEVIPASFDSRTINFDAAIERAAAVLYAPKEA